MIKLPNARTLTTIEHARNAPIRFDEISKYNGKITSGIYVILNEINRKRYIGKSTNLFQRYKQHNSLANTVTSDSPSCTKYLYQEMFEYGKGNFSFEVLLTHTCDSKTELAYINAFDTYNPNKGYNGSNKPIIRIPTISKPVQTIKGTPFNPNISYSNTPNKQNLKVEIKVLLGIKIAHY